MAALSVNKKSRVTSGYSVLISVTTFLHKREVSNTLAISTNVSFFLLFCADLKAKCAILEISSSVYSHKSEAIVPDSFNFFSPK